jgi:predicted ATPase/transcriptional regulator with XRE-family HTH domain
MDQSASASFGQLLRRFRLAAGLTQEALAERAQISPRAISDLERGQRNRPWRETIQLLADALKLPPAERAQLTASARGSASSLGSESSGALSASPAPSLDPTILPLSPDPIPASATALLGRGAEVAGLLALLGQSGNRVVTIVGPGGVGKTRLALEVARELADTHPNGVAFVSLAALADPTLVIPAIGRGLGVHDAGRDSVEDVLALVLRARHLLVVLDNCEHVLAAMADVSRLLERCPELRLLATSRAPLRLAGEREYQLRPLVVPAVAEIEHNPLTENAAVALFVDRARAVRGDLAFEGPELRAIAEICRRLDGLPLAIELAAARVRLYRPTVLLERLNGPTLALDAVGSGRRDAPARQRTLRDTVAWSYGLLAGDEQRLFRRLAVFAGGGTSEAIAVIAGDDEIAGASVEDILVELVEESLLRVEDAGPEPRFLMLETIRAFAWERLEASGETAEIRERHARYFARRAEHTYYGWRPPDIPPNAMERWRRQAAVTRAEYDNFRAALQWAQETRHGQIGLALIRGLQWFWAEEGHRGEGAHWVEAFLPAAEEIEDLATRAATYTSAGFVFGTVGVNERTREFHERALALARPSGNQRAIAHSAYWFGGFCVYLSELARAKALLGEARELFHREGRRLEEADTLRSLVDVYFVEGRSTEAEALILEMQQLLTSLPVAFFRFNLYAALVQAALHRGDWKLAVQHATEFVADCRPDSDIVGADTAIALRTLAIAHLLNGDPDRAEPVVQEALAWTTRAGEISAVGWTIELLGWVARVREDHPASKRYCAEALRIAYQRGEVERMTNVLLNLGVAIFGEAYPELLASSFPLDAEQLRQLDWSQLDRDPAKLRQARVATRLRARWRRQRRDMGWEISPGQRVKLEGYPEKLRGVLGDAEFTAAWAEGEALTLDEAVEEALAFATS